MSYENWPNDGSVSTNSASTEPVRPPSMHQATTVMTEPVYPMATPAGPNYVRKENAANYKRNVWIGFVVALVAIGGCSYAFINAVRGPIDQANLFLAAVAADDIDKASTMTSKDRACIGSDPPALRNFSDIIDLSDYNLNGSYVNKTSSGTTARVSGTVGAAARVIEFGMVKQSDVWLVCTLVVR